MKVIGKEFFARDTIKVAQDLLGKKIIHKHSGVIRSGIIVETEAYISTDPACHAYRGKTNRNASLFGPVGHAYVYFIYGNHFCVNMVARTKDVPAGGVLIRALQPVDGIDSMKQSRNIQEIRHLTNGPGKLTQALGISKKYNGIELIQENGLFVSDGIAVSPQLIKATPRIGISSAQEKLWRFIIDGNEFVSK